MIKTQNDCFNVLGFHIRLRLHVDGSHSQRYTYYLPHNRARHIRTVFYTYYSLFSFLIYPITYNVMHVNVAVLCVVFPAAHVWFLANWTSECVTGFSFKVSNLVTETFHLYCSLYFVLSSATQFSATLATATEMYVHTTTYRYQQTTGIDLLIRQTFIPWTSKQMCCLSKGARP